MSVFLVNALIALGACGGGIATIDATTGADAGENDVNEGGAPPADASTARDSSPESSDDGSLAVADAAPFDAGVACDPLPPPVLLPPAGVASGSRLTLRMVAESAPGGLAVPADVFDTALGVRCTPLKLADGTIRCVPDTTLYRPEPIFADAALTLPVVLIYLASAPATGTIEVSVAGGNVATPPLSDCAGNVRVGALGGQRSSQLYYDHWGFAQTASDAYGVFDLVPLSPDLPVLSESRTRLAGDIAVRELHSSDGARMFAQDLYDTKHGAPVAPNSGYCLPPTRAPGYRLGLPPASLPSDGTCNEATAEWCQTPDPVFSAACGAAAFLYDPSRKLTSQVTATTQAVSGCEVINLDCPWSLFAGTQTVLAECATRPVTDWMEATPMTLGSGRLTTQALSIGGVSYVPPLPLTSEIDVGRPFMDTALAIACSPGLSAADGLLRCYPRNALKVGYTDAACTQPIAVGDAAASSIYGIETTNVWTGAVRPYRVGTAQGTTHSYYGQSNGACALLDYGAAVTFTTYAATAIDDDTFAQMELRAVP